MRPFKFHMGIFLIILLLAGCGFGSPKNGPETSQASAPAPGPATEKPMPEKPVDMGALAQIKANESGKVMILMYHVIGAPQEAPWVQTAQNFRRDLETLYQEGYSLISLQDFISGSIKTPAGRTPVVMTFDDGTEGQFRYITDPDGQKKIDPDSAVGILLEFGRKHPEFGHTATFYIFNNPFRQKEFWQDKLKHLVELGFDIGNHTLNHPKLKNISGEQVQKELASLAKLVEDAVPGYQVRSLALPFGIWPQDPALAAQGSSDGYKYQNLAVLKVGANPALSHAVTGFDPLKLPRVQASTVELGRWLEYFRKNPQERYISDGDPNTVAVPAARADTIDRERLNGRELITW